MKKLFRSRRALSPVLSAVLMILVVITGMSLLFGFFVNYAGDFQRNSGSAVLEAMVVEDVFFTDSRSATIWVYNLGKIAFNISSVYVDGNLVSNPPELLRVTYKGENITAPDKLIREGAHCQIKVSSTVQIFSKAGSYTFKIVTARGSSVEIKEEY